jgi:hypothetical protein
MAEIRQWTNERDQLTSFLAQRGYSISQVEREFVPRHFSGFIYALAEMGQMLDKAGNTAQLVKKPEVIGKLLGYAQIQKDAVYSELLLALGTPTKQSDLRNGNSMTVVDTSKGGLKYMDRVWKEPVLGALRDYVMQRFREGMNKCERILLS